MCSHGGCTCPAFFPRRISSRLCFGPAARAGYQHRGQKRSDPGDCLQPIRFLRGEKNRRDAMHRYLRQCDMSSVAWNASSGDRWKGSVTDFASVATFACQKNKRANFSLCYLDLSLLCCCISRATPVCITKDQQGHISCVSELGRMKVSPPLLWSLERILITKIEGHPLFTPQNAFLWIFPSRI